ncbi:MAG: Ig-like domain-containing protein, partial [Gemmataceae bacterium]
TTTTATGQYTLTALPLGNYPLRAERPVGWLINQPSAGQYPLSIVTGTELFFNKDFGFVDRSKVNQAPVFTHVAPPSTATVGTEYTFTLSATDAENDPLLFVAGARPAGFTLDPGSGQIRWTPNASQVGTKRVLVYVQDGQGGSDFDEFTITVIGNPPPPPNTPPRIVSTPVMKAAAGRPYTYAVKAVDDENDPLQFTLLQAPSLMTISKTGVIQWTPTLDQTSEDGQLHFVKVQVADLGGWYQQSYKLIAYEGQPNRPPEFAPVPPTLAVAGQAYALQLQATDPDGDSVSFAVTTTPTTSTKIDPTGKVNWTNPVVGTYWVTATATDNFTGIGGPLSSTVRYELPVRATNAKPDVLPAAGHSVQKGEMFQFDVLATDADSDPLVYSIAGLSGATIDPLGRVRWATKTAEIKAYSFTVTATDPAGSADTETFTVSVGADTTKPIAFVAAMPDEVEPNQTVTFQVKATDAVGVAKTELFVTLAGGSPTLVPLQEGYGTFTPTVPGMLVATAYATDAAANKSEPATATVLVTNPNNARPTVSVSIAGTPANGEVFSPVAISGSVASNTAVVWKVEYIPEGGLPVVL